MISKKADNVNVDKQRHEIFLVALIIILSSVVVLFSLRFVEKKAEMTYEYVEEVDDLVPALTKTDKPAETTNVKEEVSMADNAAEQKPQEINLTVEEEKSEPVPEQEQKPEDPPVVEDYKEDEVIGYEELEDFPEFPGGTTAFMKWITDNLKYPESAKNRKDEGRVVVRFIVDAHGDVQHLQLVESKNATFGNAVMELMKKMPQWTPGTYMGKPCKALLDVPINFAIE